MRPPNGRVLRRGIGNGNAHLTVKNTNRLDAMVILTRTSSPSTPVLAFYVRRNSKTTIDNVPDGRYVVWDCLGSDWNSYMQDFLTTAEHSKWRDPLVFSTSSSTSYWSDARYNYSQRHTNWTNWTVTLGSGSSKYTRVVSEQQFPQAVEGAGSADVGGRAAQAAGQVRRSRAHARPLRTGHLSSFMTGSTVSVARIVRHERR